MKIFWLIPLCILMFFIKISVENFDDAKREQRAVALWMSAQDNPDENTNAKIRLAIENLSYSQLFDKTRVVNPTLLADLYYTLANSQHDVGKSQEYNQQAKLNYLHALKNTPTKSTNWASLAMVKWDLQEIDEDYLRYIMNAHRYGQHEPRTHIKLVQLSAKIIANDFTMSSNLEAIFLHHLNFGITHSKSRSDILEDLNMDSSIRNKYCSWIKEKHSIKAKLKCA